MANLSPLGKAVRKRRIDRGETLKQMATDVGVSSAFLSSVETWKKAAPDELVGKIIKHFNIDMLEEQEWRELAAQSRKMIKIRLDDIDVGDQNLVAEFARKFTDLSPVDKQMIQNILQKG